MFKYKFTKFFFLALIPVFSLILLKFWSFEDSKSKNLLTNNIKFRGVITNLQVSRNHGFGIITVKIDNTNAKTFSSIDKNLFYPYAIKDSIAEIYHYISPHLKKGIWVELNSNERSINFYNQKKLLYNTEITIISEELNTKFIKENSIIME